MRLLLPVHRLSTVGLLPACLREEYGLRWSQLHKLALPMLPRSLNAAGAPILAAAARLAPPSRSLAA